MVKRHWLLPQQLLRGDTIMIHLAKIKTAVSIEKYEGMHSESQMRHLAVILFCSLVFNGPAFAETEEEEMARIQKLMNQRVFGLEEQPAPAPAQPSTPAVQPAPVVQTRPAPAPRQAPAQRSPTSVFKSMFAPAPVNQSQASNVEIKGGVDTGQKISDKALNCPPFGVGDKWEIRRITSMPQGMTTTGGFSVKITENDGKLVKLDMVENDGNMHTSELRLENGMVYPSKDIMSTNNVMITYTSNVPLCPVPEIGQTIEGYGTMNGNKVGEQSSTVTSINPNYIKVTVPAGTFNTVEVVNKVVPFSGGHAAPPYTITHYYADGISAVKEIFRFPNGMTMVHELTDYKF